MINKKIFPLFVWTCSLAWTAEARSQSQPTAGSVIYVASTPCTAGTRPLPGIPANAGCELIKWKLVLSGSPGNGRYLLDCYYGLPQQGTKALINGGTRVQRSGKWTGRKGIPGYPNATLYQLDPGLPAISISFLRVSDNLLHLLDDQQHLLIGTGAWSYTLNKTKP
jgi:hypothetical protein